MKLDWMPLYRVYEEHYGVYFRVMSHKQWHDCEAELHRLAEYEKMVQHSTIDEVTPGFQQSEVEHALQESGSDTGDFQHRKFRRALPGGEFSYEIACDPVCPVELELLYWGAEWSSTRIALLLDGIPVAEQQTHTLLPGEWKAIAYSLPSALTTGKSTLRAGIRHLEGGDGGRVFHLRIIRKPTN